MRSNFSFNFRAILLFVTLVLSGCSQSDENAGRRVDQTIERNFQGVPKDKSLIPVTQILAWDNSAVKRWIAEKMASLETSIGAAKIAALQAEVQKIDETPEGYSWLYGDDPALKDAGLYFVLKAARDNNDPWAYYNVANILDEDVDVTFAQISMDLWREAADRDFLPAIVNLTSETEGFPLPDDAVMDAYLRYGFDLGEDRDGSWDLLGNMLDFYISHHEDDLSKGIISKARDRARSLEDEELALELEALMYDFGVDVRTDDQRALQTYLKLVDMGNLEWINNIGTKYMHAEGARKDIKLARDYFIACLLDEPDEYCAYNLGELHDENSIDGDDMALAYAYYQRATEIETSYRAPFDARSILILKMKAKDFAKAEKYLAAIRAEDFSTIPFAKDARPIPQN